MRWLDSLERRFGSWTIPELPLFIVFANAAVYILNVLQPLFVSQLRLDPLAIQQGQYWRLVTFLFVPPTYSPFFFMVWLFVLYQLSTSLEREWGEFRFFVYYFFGGVVTALAALFVVHGMIDNTWLNTSLFLAFFTLFPDVEFLLFFIIPVRARYLGWATWFTLTLSFVFSGWATRVGIAASLANYIVFFGPGLWERLKLRAEVHRNRKRFRGRDEDA